MFAPFRTKTQWMRMRGPSSAFLSAVPGVTAPPPPSEVATIRQGREFRDIKIVGIDKDRSGPAEDADVHTPEHLAGDVEWDVYLQLSSWVSGDWLRLFQTEWMRSSLDPKPRVTAYTHQLVLHCTLDDVERNLPEVRRAVAETNLSYRDHLEHQGRIAAQREERERIARARLEQLEKRLNF